MNWDIFLSTAAITLAVFVIVLAVITVAKLGIWIADYITPGYGLGHFITFISVWTWGLGLIIAVVLGLLS